MDKKAGRIKSAGLMQNHRAQGLPLNFIVLAAIAILILILVVGFVIAGGSSFGSAVSPAAFSANCKTICSEMQRQASTIDYLNAADASNDLYDAYLVNTKSYCVTQDIKGGGTQSCIGIEPCYVTYANNVQKLVQCSASGSPVGTP